HRSSVGDLRPLDGHRVRSTKNNLTQPPRIPALAEDAVIKRSRALSLRLCVLLAAVSRPAPRRYLRADTPVKGPTRASLIGPEHSWAEVPHPRTALRLRVRFSLHLSSLRGRPRSKQASLGAAGTPGTRTSRTATDARDPLNLRRRPCHSAQDIPRGGASASHSQGCGIARHGWRTVAPSVRAPRYCPAAAPFARLPFVAASALRTRFAVAGSFSSRTAVRL